MKKNLKQKIDKIEDIIRTSGRNLLLVTQISVNQFRCRGKLYTIPEGTDLQEFLRVKFKGNQIILDDLYNES
ncbi:MAG TPA: hypothetical protein PKD03_01640 [Ignavibacteriaceae bacterium]|nr:hypothetical protein [Ignavibacteriaceae bacterium]